MYSIQIRKCGETNMFGGPTRRYLVACLNNTSKLPLSSFAGNQYWSKAVIELERTVCLVISIIWEGISRDRWVTKHKMSRQIISCCMWCNHSSYTAKFDFHLPGVETVYFRSRKTPYGKRHSVTLPMYARLGFFSIGVRQTNSDTGYFNPTLHNFSYTMGF